MSERLDERIAAELSVPIKPSDVHGMAALLAAEATAMRKLKGEMDTEFVKRIVAAYLNATIALGITPVRP